MGFEARKVQAARLMVLADHGEQRLAHCLQPCAAQRSPVQPSPAQPAPRLANLPACACLAPAGVPFACQSTITDRTYLAPRAAAVGGARSSSGGSRGKFLLKPRARGCGSAPVVMWVAAQAGGQLCTRVEIDGAGQLAVEGGMARLELMGVQTSLKGAPAAERRPRRLPRMRRFACLTLAACMHWRPGVLPLPQCWRRLLGGPRPLLCCCMSPTGLPCTAACCADLCEVKRQLQVAGRVLTWLLHVGNPGLTAAMPVQLHGVIAAQGQRTVEARLQIGQW